VLLVDDIQFMTRARAINNQGQIVAEQQDITNNSIKSFMLTPRNLTKTRK
jgi:hypothetical protein